MPEGKQVLIVDDSEEEVVFLSQILEDHRYPYRVARNGKEAMSAMRQSRPDLVLLDIMMPRKSGFAVFQEMRQDPDLGKVPVIIITGASEASGVDMKTGAEKPKQSYGDAFARQFGVDFYEKFKTLDPEGFIEKPIDPPALVQKIEELLS